MRLVAFLALALLAMPGCSSPAAKEPLPEEWRGRDLREPGWTNQTLPANWTLNLEYLWPSGKRVEWDWIALDPYYVHFQLVRMEGSTARALVARDAQEGGGQITVTQAGTHQIAWVNEFWKPVRIAFQVPEGYAAQMHPPGEGPGCVSGRIALAAC